MHVYIMATCKHNCHGFLLWCVLPGWFLILSCTQGMSRTPKENLFCQAAFPRSVWELAVKVMNMFENGEKKLSKKNLCSTPRMEQNHFVPLDTSFQESALEKVLCKELSLNELKIHCQTYRALVEVRKNFMKCTNSDTWEEVERRFGTYAEEKRLMQFVTLPFTNDIPQVFKDYCQAALTMTTTESSAADCSMVHQNDARGYVFCMCARTRSWLLLPTSNAR